MSGSSSTTITAFVIFTFHGRASQGVVAARCNGAACSCINERTGTGQPMAIHPYVHRGPPCVAARSRAKRRGGAECHGQKGPPSSGSGWRAISQRAAQIAILALASAFLELVHGESKLLVAVLVCFVSRPIALPRAMLHELGAVLHHEIVKRHGLLAYG